MTGGWAIAQLRDLIDFVIGGDWGKAPDFDHEDYVDVLCIRGTELRTWSEDKGSSAAPRRIKKASLLKRELQEGHVILEVSGGGPEQPVGRIELIDKAAMAHNRGTPRICTNFFRKLEIVDEIDAGYLVYFLKHFYATGEVTKYQAGSNNLRNLKYPEYETITVPIAPLPEQQRIVEKIETLFAELDKGEEALREVQKLLARYRQSVLKAAVTGTLTAKGPPEWVPVVLGDLLADIRYGTAKKCRPDVAGTPVLRIPNVVGGDIDLADLKFTELTEKELEKLSLREGDVLIVRSNGSANLVGRGAIVTADAVGMAYAGYLIRLRLDGKRILPAFLHIVLNSPAVRARIERQAKSTSGVHNLNSAETKAIAFDLPDIDTQAEIVEAVEEAITRIEQGEAWCETELKRSAALRQSILKDAFSGKLVPQDPSDEPADKLLERISAARENKPIAKRKKTKA